MDEEDIAAEGEDAEDGEQDNEADEAALADVRLL